MKNLNMDQMFLVLTMLKLQNLDKRVCDVLPCEYTCTFEETDLYKDMDLISIDIEDDPTILLFNDENQFRIWLKPSTDEHKKFSIKKIIKLISFEDKV